MDLRFTVLHAKVLLLSLFLVFIVAHDIISQIGNLQSMHVNYRFADLNFDQSQNLGFW